MSQWYLPQANGLKLDAICGPAQRYLRGINTQYLFSWSSLWRIVRLSTFGHQVLLPCYQWYTIGTIHRNSGTIKMIRYSYFCAMMQYGYLRNTVTHTHNLMLAWPHKHIFRSIGLCAENPLLPVVFQHKNASNAQLRKIPCCQSE